MDRLHQYLRPRQVRASLRAQEAGQGEHPRVGRAVWECHWSLLMVISGLSGRAVPSGPPSGLFAGGKLTSSGAYLGSVDVSEDTDRGSRRRPGRAALVVVAIVVVALVVLGIWAFTVKGVRLPKFSLPADHGVSASDPDWLRCTVETIERHPQLPGVQHGFVIEFRQGEWLVSATWTDTRIEVRDEMLFYGSPDSVESRQMPLDCPDVSPSGSVDTPSGTGGAAS